jgi:hypothetical protein
MKNFRMFYFLFVVNTYRLLNQFAANPVRQFTANPARQFAANPARQFAANPA